MTAPLPPIGTRVTVAVNRDTRRWAIDGRVGHVAAHETTCEPWKVEVSFDLADAVLLPPEWCLWAPTDEQEEQCQPPSPPSPSAQTPR